MAGRRSKYTPETVDKLTQAIRLGATYRLACDYAGISDDTFARWRERYAGFAEAIKLAEGEGALKSLAVIERAANGVKGEDGEYILAPTWQAAAWKLERRYPEMYGKQRMELTGANGGPVVIKGYISVSPDDWDTDGKD